MGFIDLIIIAKDQSLLDSKMNEVVTLYKNNKEYEINNYLNKDLNNVTYQKYQDNNYIYLKADMEYQFVTPGLDKIIKDFHISSERTIVNEKE